MDHDHAMVLEYLRNLPAGRLDVLIREVRVCYWHNARLYAVHPAQHKVLCWTVIGEVVSNFVYRESLCEFVPTGKAPWKGFLMDQFGEIAEGRTTEYASAALAYAWVEERVQAQGWHIARAPEERKGG